MIVAGEKLIGLITKCHVKMWWQIPNLCVIKLIKSNDDMCHQNWHHIGILKFATYDLAHKIKIIFLFKIDGKLFLLK